MRVAIVIAIFAVLAISTAEGRPTWNFPSWSDIKKTVSDATTTSVEYAKSISSEAKKIAVVTGITAYEEIVPAVTAKAKAIAASWKENYDGQ